MRHQQALRIAPPRRIGEILLRQGRNSVPVSVGRGNIVSIERGANRAGAVDGDRRCQALLLGVVGRLHQAAVSGAGAPAAVRASNTEAFK